jgi:hypothetical protein
LNIDKADRENLIGFLSNICGPKEAKESEIEDSPRSSEYQSAKADFLNQSSSSDSDNEV